MNNSYSNHTCTHCGRDEKSFNLGKAIRHESHSLLKIDNKIEAMNISLLLKDIKYMPEKIALFKINPFHYGRL